MAHTLAFLVESKRERSLFMSMSLRDQLLAAGLVSQKQARDAERQQQHQQRQQPKKKQAAAASVTAAIKPAAPSAKVARDLALNRQQQEKAQRKALMAQIKQLVDQNRLPPVEDGEAYNFVDGNKVRRIAVNAAVRAGIARGDLAIVRHAGGYDLVPRGIADRIRDRDPQTVVAAGLGSAPVPDAVPADDPYEAFKVPDDLMW